MMIASLSRPGHAVASTFPADIQTPSRAEDRLEPTKQKRATARPLPLPCTRAPRPLGWRTGGLAAGVCLSAMVGTANALPADLTQMPIGLFRAPMSAYEGTWNCDISRGQKSVQHGILKSVAAGDSWHVTSHEAQSDNATFRWDAAIAPQDDAWAGEGTCVVTEGESEAQGTVSVRATPWNAGWRWQLDGNLTGASFWVRMDDVIAGRYLMRDMFVLDSEGGKWLPFAKSSCHAEDA